MARLNQNGEFWLDRPTLITGATGFLGGWLASRLVDCGAAVVCLVRDRVPQSEFVRRGASDRATVVRGDLGDRELIERVLGEYEIDTVFHLGAQTIVGVANKNPISTFESNVRGTWNLLEACRRSPLVRCIVVASSDKAYGSQNVLPYREDVPLQGEHPYDVSKSCADLIARCYAITYDLPVAVTRCGNFYGGGDLNWNRLVPGTIRSVVRRRPPVIRSDGRFVRDYLYVEDAAAAYTRLAECVHANHDVHGLAFNFSTETPVSALEVVELILEQMGSELKPEIRNEASNEIRQQYLCSERARRLLGWEPRFDLRCGLQRTVAWYRGLLSQ